MTSDVTTAAAGLQTSWACARPHHGTLLPLPYNFHNKHAFSVMLPIVGKGLMTCIV